MTRFTFRRSSSSQAVLARLRRHEPVPNATVRAQIVLRWLVTVGMVALLPLSAVMVWAPHRFLTVSGWVVAGFVAVSLLGLTAGMLARRRHGIHRQWGLGPLDDAQARELSELSGRYLPIQDIVDDWLHRWISARSELRGLDLLLLRRGVIAYERALRREEMAVQERGAGRGVIQR